MNMADRPKKKKIQLY